MRNEFPVGSLKYQHLIGLIAEGAASADIAEQLDCTLAYVDAVEAELATQTADLLARYDAAAQVARLNLIRMARGVDTVPYDRGANLPTIKSTVEEDRYVLSMPALTAEIDSSAVVMAATDVDLSTAANWATGKDGYAVAAARAGKDFNVFLCVPAEDDPLYLLSDAATAPTGYTLGTDCRILAGFHCTRLAQSANSRNLTGLPFPTPPYPDWTGLAVGDILPSSIWDVDAHDIPIISYL